MSEWKKRFHASTKAASSPGSRSTTNRKASSFNVSRERGYIVKLGAQSWVTLWSTAPCSQLPQLARMFRYGVLTWKVSSSKTTRRATSPWASQRDSNSPWFCSKCHSIRRRVVPRTGEICYRRCLFEERTPMCHILALPWWTAPTGLALGARQFHTIQETRTVPPCVGALPRPGENNGDQLPG